MKRAPHLQSLLNYRPMNWMTYNLLPHGSEQLVLAPSLPVSQSFSEAIAMKATIQISASL